MSQKPLSMGDRLRQLRMARGQSLQQAASAIGCTKPHLSELERGTSSNPTLNLLRAIAKTYGVSVAYIIGDPS